MLSFYMTVCRPLTARIEDRTYFSSFSFEFLNSLGIIFTKGKNNNIERIVVFRSSAALFVFDYQVYRYM